MHDAGERDDRHLARTAANVNNHRSRRFGNRQTDSDRRRHRLLDQIDLPDTRRMRGILDRALLDLRDVAGNGDHHTRLGVFAPEPPGADLFDEIADHRLRDVEVRNHAGLHRTDGHDVSRRATEHPLGLVAHGEHALRALFNGDDARFPQHDAAVLHVHEAVRRAEVDAHVGGKESFEF